MDLVKVLKKAMVDKNVSGYPELSALSGVSYDITLRLMKGAKNIKLSDVEATASALDVKIKFISLGED